MKKIITAISFVFGCNWLSAQNTSPASEKLSANSTSIYLLKIDSITWLYGAGILVVVLIVGYLIYRFFKNTEVKKSDLIPVIKSIYPNPSPGPITIEIAGKASTLKVFSTDDEQLGAFAISTGDVRFDLSKSPRGHYVVVAYYGETQSNVARFELE